MGPVEVVFGTTTGSESGLDGSSLHPSPQRKQGKTRSVIQNSGPDSLARASGLDGKDSLARASGLDGKPGFPP